MKKFFQEFKDFIQKGNILDLAVGIIIGNAFNKIVSSLVNDIIMPLFSLIGGTNLQEGKLMLVDAVLDSEGNVIKNAVTLNYGLFLQYTIDFLIIAFTVFVILKILKRMREKAEVIKNKIKNTKNIENEEVETKPSIEDLLVEIRNLLKKEKE